MTNEVSIELVEDGNKFTIWAIVSSGQYSFRAFTEKYSDEMPYEWATMMRRLDRIASHGPTRNKRHFRSIPPNIFEAKTDGGLRILFFYTRKSCVICTSGFYKSSQKTPNEQKEIARRNMSAFKDAQGAGLIKCIIPDGKPEPRRSPV